MTKPVNSSLCLTSAIRYVGETNAFTRPLYFFIGNLLSLSHEWYKK